jgi:nitrite reductase/ring-hydroxylating ferredoxin subunit
LRTGAIRPKTGAGISESDVMDEDSTALLERSIGIVENRVPELAERYMKVPLDYYVSEEFDARERHLFMTQPRALLASSEIANPDDFHVRMAMGRSILLTRDADGKAHAFLNYCRHRGAEPARGCGNARRHSCPYHAWTYNSKGELVAMPLADRNADLDYAQLGLVELPSEERHGLIWVILTPGLPIDVAAHLGEVDAQIAALGVGRMRYHNALPHAPLSTGWKSVAEGLVESLHVPFVHRETFYTNPQATGVDMAVYDRFGPHVRFTLPMFGPDDLARIKSVRTELGETVAQVWFLSPGILIAQELYGMIFGDLEPGPRPGTALFRYGWMSPVEEPPEGMLTPRQMADRAATAIREDAPVWEGCGRGLDLGGHDYALIGKNEKGVQIFHEGLAEQTGYTGLSYI